MLKKLLKLKVLLLVLLCVSACKSTEPEIKTSKVIKPASERMKEYRTNSSKLKSRCPVNSNMDKSIKQQLISIKRVAPHYPSSAGRSAIEGFVTMEFDLEQPKLPLHLRGEEVPDIFKEQLLELSNSPKAVPVNINVIDHYPNRTFDHSAKIALQQWVYETQNKEKLIPRKCMKVTLDFLMGP